MMRQDAMELWIEKRDMEKNACVSLIKVNTPTRCSSSSSWIIPGFRIFSRLILGF